MKIARIGILNCIRRYGRTGRVTKTNIKATLFRLAFGLEAVMPVEFQIPNLRIQVRHRLSEAKSEQVRREQLLELGEKHVYSMAILEQEQRRRKAFVD